MSNHRAGLVPVIGRAGLVNVVPTALTKDVANAMLKHAREDGGPDAAAKLLPLVPMDQWPALIGLLLTGQRIKQLPGRPRKPMRFTEEERRDGNRRYRRGDRDPETVARWREYQRESQRRRTALVGRHGRP